MVPGGDKADRLLARTAIWRRNFYNGSTAETADMLKACGGEIVQYADEPTPGRLAVHEMGGARMGADPQRPGNSSFRFPSSKNIEVKLMK
jgi:choline dehydrogenase-like flavoprotein